MLIFCFLHILTHSEIPVFLQDLAKQALNNAKVKIPKEKRQETKYPGEYIGHNYQFKLLKTLTSSFTNDIKSFATNNNYFAIIKRKKFNISDDFVFIDPKTQALYRLKQKVASENNVIIYQSNNITIFDLFTNFKLHKKTSIDNIKKRKPNGNFDFQFGLEDNTNYPKMNKYLDSGIEYGFGIKAAIDIDITCSFNYIWDLKIISSISLNAVVGSEIKIPDNYSGSISNIVILSLSHEIPGLGMSFNFLGLEMQFGLFFDFNVIFDDIKVEIPIGFDYYKGYKIKGTKYFEISGNSIVNPDWEFVMTNLPDKSSTNSIIESFKTTKFYAIIDLVNSFGLKFVIGDVSLSIDIGLKYPFTYNFKYNDQKCMYPYLEANLELPIKMFYQVFGLTILYYTIFNSKYDERIIKTLNYGTFCIGQDAPKTTDSIDEYYCSLGMKYDLNLEFRQNETYKNIRLDIKEKDIDKKLCIYIAKNSRNNYQLLYNDNINALNENIIIIDINSTIIDIPVKRNNNIEEENVTFKFYIISYGSSKLEELNNTNTINLRFYSDTLTAFISPCINGVSYLQFAGSFKYTFVELPINENKVLSIFSSNKNVNVPVFSNQIQISNTQSYAEINIDIYYLVYYHFNVICNNGKTIKAVLNDKDVYTEKVKNGVTQFLFFKKGNFKFYPICENNSGKFCQIEYPKAKYNGYDLIKYPNRDGISTTGGGFLVEIIPVVRGKSFYYYKTNDGTVETIRQYQNNIIHAEISIDDLVNYYGFDEGRRVCIVEKYNRNNIIPFSRKYFAEHSDELLNILGMEKNFSLIRNDDNGCLIFHSKLIKSNKINTLPKEISDLPIVLDLPSKTIEITTFEPTRSNTYFNPIAYTEFANPTFVSSEETSKPKSKKNKTIIIAVTCVIIVIVIIVIIIVVLYKTNHLNKIY